MSAKPNQCHICKTILLSRVGLLKHLQTQHAAAEGSTSEEEIVEEDSTEISDSGSTASENRVIEANVESPESGSVESVPPPEIIEIPSSSSATESPDVEHYICDSCKDIFESKSDLEDHVQSAHANSTPSPVEPEMPVQPVMPVRLSCSNKATAIAFNQPVRNYFCHVCDQFFTSELVLNEHLKDIHELKPFICIYCDGEFFFENLLRNHEIHDHQQEKVYRCEVCQKRFVTDTGLEQHRCNLEEGKN